MASHLLSTNYFTIIALSTVFKSWRKLKKCIPDFFLFLHSVFPLSSAIRRHRWCFLYQNENMCILCIVHWKILIDRSAFEKEQTSKCVHMMWLQFVGATWRKTPFFLAHFVVISACSRVCKSCAIGSFFCTFV